MKLVRLLDGGMFIFIEKENWSPLQRTILSKNIFIYCFTIISVNEEGSCRRLSGEQNWRVIQPLKWYILLSSSLVLSFTNIPFKFEMQVKNFDT